MSESTSGIRKTRVRIELTPSETVADALRLFTNNKQRVFRAYTNTYATLETFEYGGGVFDKKISDANNFLKRPLARSALFLTEHLMLEEQEDGSTHLHLEPRNPYQVIAYEGAIKKIADLEGDTRAHNLFVELPKGSLVPQAKQEEAKERFTAMADDPVAYAQLTLNLPRLAFKHFIEYSQPQTHEDKAS